MMGNEEYSDDQALGYLQEYAKLFNLDKKSGIELPESAGGRYSRRISEGVINYNDKKEIDSGACDFEHGSPVRMRCAGRWPGRYIR